MIESFRSPPQHVFLESDVYFATAVSVLHFEKIFSPHPPTLWCQAFVSMSTGIMLCEYTQEEMVNVIAMTSMFLAFLQRNEDTLDENIHVLEKVMNMVSLLLQATGDSPFMSSIKYIWRCGSNSLGQIEAQFFPDQPAQTPCDLVVPNLCSSLAILRQDCFQSKHHLISTGKPALVAVHTWVWARYSNVVQRECYEIMSDALLLIEMAEDLAGISFEA